MNESLPDAAPTPPSPVRPLEGDHAIPLTIIQPARPAYTVPFKELWQFRRLLIMLVWRDFKIRYAQSKLGGLWSVLSPLFNVLLYTFVFSSLAKMPSDQVPYALFNYVALIPWTIFSTCLIYSANCLISSSSLLQKIYFPRLLLPLHGVLTNVPDLIIMLGVQFIVLGCLGGVRMSWRLLTLPLYTIWLLTVALAAGLLLSSLIARYKELAGFVPLLMQLWFYATPIAYPTASLPGQMQYVAMLNPFSWIANGFRWAMLGTKTAPEPFMIVPLGLTFAALIAGVWTFRATENELADVL